MVEAVKTLVMKLIKSKEDEIQKLREFLETLDKSPKEIIEVNSTTNWDPTKIKWVKTRGFSGPYERYPAKGGKVESSADYRRMLADLKAHNGKLTRNGYFYWLFDDGATVGRKKRN